MSTTFQYRPSKRPKVAQVKQWDNIFQDSVDLTWRGLGIMSVKVENGYPFPDFYRVTIFSNGEKKVSKLFYGESAWNETERYVYDQGFYSVLGKI